GVLAVWHDYLRADGQGVDDRGDRGDPTRERERLTTFESAEQFLEASNGLGQVVACVGVLRAVMAERGGHHDRRVHRATRGVRPTGRDDEALRADVAHGGNASENVDQAPKP